jgi:hypothetical protein
LQDIHTKQQKHLDFSYTRHHGFSHSQPSDQVPAVRRLKLAGTKECVDTENVIPLSDLGFENLFFEGLGTNVRFGVESCIVETFRDTFVLVIECMCNWDDNDLSERKPEVPKHQIQGRSRKDKLFGTERGRPFSAKMLCEDGDHTFDTAEDSSVNHDGSVDSHSKFFAFSIKILGMHVFRLVGQIEALG